MNTISVEELEKIDSSKITIVDVRPADQYSRGSFPGAVNIPLDEFEERMESVDREKMVYVLCHTGDRSRDCVEKLSDAGYEAVNIEGGYRAYLRLSLSRFMENDAKEQKELKTKEIEHSIIKTFRKTVWRPFTKALNEYQLIQEGDKIAVCISGGKDSTIVAALCKEALGADRVVGVLMPNGVQSDIDDAQAVVNHLGIPHMTVNIGAAYEALTHAIVQAKGYDVVTGRTDLSKDAAINTPPRLRMATLYAVGQNLPNGARVANTCNGSEDYVGYSTKYGDSAGDFSPLAQLVVEEVRQIGKLLDIPLHLVDKVPSDGLSGQSDEDKLGFTYAVLDHYIRTGEIEDQITKERIDYLNRINKHKLELMPSFDPNL